jgi:integrase
VLADVRRGIWREPVDLPAVVEQLRPEPTFHEFASAYVERRQHEVEARTVEGWRWALEGHLLPLLARYRLSQFTAELIDGYKTAKLRQREELLMRLQEWEQADPSHRGRRPPRSLSNRSINETIKVLALVLDDAIDYGHLETNPARGKKRRLKAKKPDRTFLELDEVQALLAAAGAHRALLATMILAGPRISETCNARWRDADLARGKFRIPESKTDAGERAIDISPWLLDELKAHKARTRHDQPSDFIFPTRNGTPQNRSNIRSGILIPTVARANTERAKDGLPPIEGVTNHALRRTFASLLYESGASPAYVMAQMGHESSALALEVYAKVQQRQRDTGTKMDALIRPPDWARMGTKEPVAVADVLVAENGSGT